MFTGIIQTVGHLLETKQTQFGDYQLRIRAPGLGLPAVNLGDSIAVNGVCLTVTEKTATEFSADVSKESMAHTLLHRLDTMQQVNLEKALTLSTPLGGHLVSGHVDGIGTIQSAEMDARSLRLTVKAPVSLAKYIAAKGSITVDGVSLTVNRVEGNRFDLNIVPHTARGTTLIDARPGRLVHLEVDLLARYLERLLTAGPDTEQQTSGSLTLDKLVAAGFAKRTN